MVAVAAALLTAPATAPAETSCLFAFGVVQVNLTAVGDRAALLVATDGEIAVVGSNGQVLCSGSAGPPRVSNTDVIQVRSSPQLSGNQVTILDANRFVPGKTGEGEGGGDREIEITVNLNNAPNSSLSVSTDSAGGSLRFGSGGINPNATPVESVPDADISLTGVPAGALSLLGGNGPDTLGAQGGAGTGDARGDPVVLGGGGGSDLLTGGGGPDALFGSSGGDVVVGAGGNDTLVDGGGPDDDTIDGGPGVDLADYDGPLAGVSIDLGIAGPQPTGAGKDSLANVEDVRGSRSADVLRGDGRSNTLTGRNGADVLLGRGGQDVLEGGEDADALDVRDGGADIADCGSGTDKVTADLQGTDLLAGCENVLFGPVMGGAGTGGPSGSGGGPGPGATADTVAPRFVGRVRAVPARFRVRRAGTSFRYALSEAATVTFTIQRRSRGRRWRRVGAFRTRAAAGANRTRFNGRLRRKKLKPGPYRALVAAVDDAGNASRRARVRLKVLPPVR
jgi:Ca2+-binding RTX toxin-like protein